MVEKRSNGVALVTGSSRGIGAEIARRLARDGFSIAVNYARDARSAEKIVDAILAEGSRAVAVAADVASGQAVRDMFGLVESELGPVDVLVNNAGIMMLAPIGETTDETFDAMMSVNVKGAFNGMREAANRMKDGGRVINVSSALTKTLLPTYGAYAATKSAVEALTMVFAKELRGRNITVNAVAPGPTETELFLAGKTRAKIDAMAALSPLNRLGLPGDVAEVVSFLAGPASGWINGQTIRVNGGLI